eukprot:gnl/TRDRNA2_/TRDRNA2_167590_c1_seq1.p1 gnl/TRDRNA2_/TRDRNA2_167590_c1~~gnl/TRDRNA2_/TRDRNA2_167590_c1_seq1.p1  ORF type:complete len:704 (-),score=128.29 gnl/TRDRNA2_/TRDRNA2_167590_c1_seq1:33-2144(-)
MSARNKLAPTNKLGILLLVCVVFILGYITGHEFCDYALPGVGEEGGGRPRSQKAEYGAGKAPASALPRPPPPAEATAAAAVVQATTAAPVAAVQATETTTVTTVTTVIATTTTTVAAVQVATVAPSRPATQATMEPPGQLDKKGRVKFHPLPGPGSLVLDCGASYGVSAKEFHETWGANVVLVEPNPGWFYSYLKLNYGDQEPAYTLLHAAASDKDGEEITFYKACNDYLASIRKDWITSDSMRFGYEKCFSEEKVKTRNLDSLIAQFGKPAFVKVDVEGWEEIVMQGLTQTVPLITFEWSYPETLREANRIMLRFWGEVGMKAWSYRYGDMPFTEIPSADSWRCLRDVDEATLDEMMRGDPLPPDLGPIGMIFIAAEFTPGFEVAGCVPPQPLKPVVFEGTPLDRTKDPYGPWGTGKKAIHPKRVGAVPSPNKGDWAWDIGGTGGSLAQEWNRLWDCNVLVVEANGKYVNNELKPKFSGKKEFAYVYAALSDTDGQELTYYDSPTNHFANSVRRDWLADERLRFGKDKDKGIKEERVKTRTLDSLIAEFGLPTFIRIDIEGWEEVALRGLTKLVPMLTFEYSYPETLRGSARALTRLWSELGYKGFVIKPGNSYSFIPRPSEFRCLREVLTEAVLKELMEYHTKETGGLSYGIFYVTEEIPKQSTQVKDCNPPQPLKPVRFQGGPLDPAQDTYGVGFVPPAP